MGCGQLKKGISLILVTVMVSLTGCATTVNSKEAVKVKPETIIGEDYDENGGADSAGNSGDNKNSRYYVNPDFYNMKSDDQVKIIPNFKTMQQTTEWSCGNVTALMVLNHFGKTDTNEMEIAEIMKSSTDLDIPDGKPGSANNFHEYGSDVSQLYDYFNDLDGFKVLESSYRESYNDEDLISKEDGNTPADIGNLKPSFSSMSLYTSDNDDDSENFVENAKDSYFVKWIVDNIEAGLPIMVEWADWNGHWQAIIGYDNNGTLEIGDDILIFADPYDTTDHWQDGYYYFPLERWFYMWNDRSVAPKPFQIQPYIIVDQEN